MSLTFPKLIKFFIFIPLILSSFFVMDRTIHVAEPIPMPKVDWAQVKCLATGVFFEAGSESYMGQAAVARVIMNRVKHGFASTPCKVIYQTHIVKKDNERFKLCQFSWVCDNKVKPNEKDPRFVQAMDIAYKVIAFDAYKDVVPKSALFFHSSSVEPNWPYRKLKQIGNHIFYARGKK
jgi:spore germination cell wall hydrolase CwlJ-like protein